MSPHELQLLQLLPQGLISPHELQLLQVSQEDVVPHELQPRSQLEEVPQHPEYDRPRHRCLPNADAESAMTIHTVNSTAANMAIRRMTLPPAKNGSHTCNMPNRANAAQENSSHPRPSCKVQDFFPGKSGQPDFCNLGGAGGGFPHLVVQFQSTHLAYGPLLDATVAFVRIKRRGSGRRRAP